MVLSDRSIKEAIAAGRLLIDPLDPQDIQPASVDVHIDRVFRVFKVSSRPFIDPRQPMDDLTDEVVIEDGEPFFIHPGEFVLASTLEVVSLPDDIVAQVEGKSSLGRIGLLIHATAGYVDPGWSGKLTLELSNVAKMPIALHFGMKIGQLSFLRMTTPVDRPYGSPGLRSKYQGQMGPTPSRAYSEFSDSAPPTGGVKRPE
ncbi:MAG: dCTP deaminase [Chloroflexota bacterium]|nr:dCTP deaminase [Chloroflexota bacterium]